MFLLWVVRGYPFHCWLTESWEEFMSQSNGGFWAPPKCSQLSQGLLWCLEESGDDTLGLFLCFRVEFASVCMYSHP